MGKKCPRTLLEYRAPMDEKGKYVSKKHPYVAVMLNGMVGISDFIVSIPPLRFLPLFRICRKDTKR